MRSQSDSQMPTMSNLYMYHQHSVKENRRPEQSLRTSIEDVDDTKENQHFTHVKQSDMYLQRSAQKSRQCLSSIGSFYGAAMPQSFHSSTPTIPSQWLNSKRGPDLMPDPTPNKLPRLSDGVRYSMSILPSDQKQQPALQGFSNLGNTCYMNAILQSLFGLDTLTTDLLTTNQRMLKTLSPQSLYSALVKLLFSRRQNASEISRRDYLRRVKTAISTTDKRFSGNRQHDAHEFLCQVLDQLKEEVIAINKSTQCPPRDTTNDSEFVNPTSRNFEFEVLHTISCEHCREKVTNTEQFLDVSVDLPKRKVALTPRSLQDALSIFFREENVEYTCEKCGHNKSNVTHKCVRLPRVFILHLKRYSYNQMFSRNTKMGQNVSIPLYLSLDSHCDEGTQPTFPAPLHDYFEEVYTRFTDMRKVIFTDTKGGVEYHFCQTVRYGTRPRRPQTPDNDQKYVHPLDDSREDMGSRRKLNYPRFNFKNTASVATSGSDSVVITDVTNYNTDADDFKKVDGDTRAPTLEDESKDTELTRAIEMSLKEQAQQNQMVRDYGDDSAGSFQRVLEMSRTNGAPDKKVDGDTRAPTLEDESKDTELTRAIEMSLKEQAQQDQMVRDYGDDSADSFQRVLETSRTNGAPDTAAVWRFARCLGQVNAKKDLDGLTEKQLIQIAIEESEVECTGVQTRLCGVKVYNCRCCVSGIGKWDFAKADVTCGGYVSSYLTNVKDGT